MRRYETFVILDPDISQEERDPAIERVKELIAQMEGFLVFVDVWGDRKLAYEIKKKQRGYYVRFDYCGSAPLVNEIERFCRIDDRALKYMTVLLDAEADLEKIKEEMAEAERKEELARATEAVESTASSEPPQTETSTAEPSPVETKEEA